MGYMDVHKAELEVECKEILSLGEVMKQLQSTYTGLKHVRVPVCNSGPPNHTDFDRICAAITGSKFAAPVVINCQAGLTRATTGQVVACLFREMQVGSSFSGLVNTVPGLNLDLLKMDNYVMDMEKDHLFRGEFDVVKQLLNEFPDMKKAKDQADKLIDLCGPPKTGGTGIKQLRENIPSKPPRRPPPLNPKTSIINPISLLQPSLGLNGNAVDREDCQEARLCRWQSASLTKR